MNETSPRRNPNNNKASGDNWNNGTNTRKHGKKASHPLTHKDKPHRLSKSNNYVHQRINNNNNSIEDGSWRLVGYRERGNGIVPDLNNTRNQVVIDGSYMINASERRIERIDPKCLDFHHQIKGEFVNCGVGVNTLSEDIQEESELLDHERCNSDYTNINEKQKERLVGNFCKKDLRRTLHGFVKDKELQFLTYPSKPSSFPVVNGYKNRSLVLKRNGSNSQNVKLTTGGLNSTLAIADMRSSNNNMDTGRVGLSRYSTWIGGDRYGNVNPAKRDIAGRMLSKSLDIKESVSDPGAQGDMSVEVLKVRRRKHARGQRGQDTMLPPIDRQYTLYRERSFLPKGALATTWGTPGSVQKIQEQHWNPRPRLIREDTSRKIISHLRKQFTRRLDKRFNEFYSDDEMEGGDDGMKDYDFPAEAGTMDGLDERHLEAGYWKYKQGGLHDPTEVGGESVYDNNRITPVQMMSRPRSKADASSTSRPASKGRDISTSTPTANKALDRLSVAVARPVRELSRGEEMALFPDIENYRMPEFEDSNTPSLSPERRQSPTKRPTDSRQGVKSRGLLLPSISDNNEFSDHPSSVQNDENDDSIEGTGNFLTKGALDFLNSSAKKKKVFGMTGLDTRENTEFIGGDGAEDELKRMLQQETKINLHYQDMDISPVATPYIFSRPQTTRTGRKTTEHDKLVKVIHGEVHVKVKAKSRLLRMYVLSNGIDTEVERSHLMQISCYLRNDTEVERSHLMQSAYPELRHKCKLRGYDLELIDLMWGVDGLQLDEHDWIDLAIKTINSCHSNAAGLSVLAFVAQKYGQPSLPNKIPATEMDAILVEMNKVYRSTMQELEKLVLTPEVPPSMTLSSLTKGSKANTMLSVLSNMSNRSKSQQSKQSTLIQSSTKTPTQPMSPEGEEEDAPKEEGVSKDEFLQKLERVKAGEYSLRMLAGEYGMPEDQFYPDIKLVKSWFSLDTNVVPHVYKLNAISTQYPDISAKDRPHREEAEKHWRSAAKRMLHLLRHYSQLAGTDKFNMNKYNISLLEQQVEECLYEQRTSPDSSCLWIRRELLDIHQSMDDGKVKDYLDLADTGRYVSQTSQQNLQRITTALTQCLDSRKIMRFTIQWNRQGVNPDKVRTHSTYIHHLCKDVYRRVLEAMETAEGGDDPGEGIGALGGGGAGSYKNMCTEIRAHTTYCQARAYSFYGRKDIINSIKKYVRSGCRSALVLHGMPGCGKTSLLAKAAIDVHKWLRDQSAVVIQRAIGVTASSVNVRLLLRLITLQLCYTFTPSEADDVPRDMKTLANQLVDRLSHATEERPIIIFLDSLHHLTDEHNGRKLAWLPKELPPHVKLIVSTDPSDKYECLEQLKQMLPKGGDDMCIAIKTVSEKDANVILREWYKRTDREITSQQHAFLLDHFNKCPHPLYLKVLFNESLKWSSGLDLSTLKIMPDMKKMAAFMYVGLERKHGEPLVRRALGYITASKNGISSTEMEDVLSLDEAVMADVALHSRLQIRRLPSLFWIRLKDDLAQYLNECYSDNTVVYRWTHSHFHDAAVDRYLNSKDKAPSYHRILAEYFLNEWFEKPKSFPGNDIGVQRHVMNQDLYTEEEAAQQQHKKQQKQSASNSDEEEVNSNVSNQESAPQAIIPKTRHYNLRRLSELPYHLLKSAQNDVLKKTCLCNFEFAWGKISACSLRAFFEDIQMALSIEPNDNDIKLLSDTLFLSANILSKDTTQFPSQMVGRLFDIITKDLPIAPQDPVNYPYLKPFLKAARKPSLPSILPSLTCLTPPGGIMFDLLCGHTEEITAAHISPDNLFTFTASQDHTLKVWEMRTGRVVKTIVGVGKDVSQIRLGLGGKVIITSEVNCIRIWDRKTGVCLSRFKMDDPSSVAVTGDGKTIAAFTHGTNTMMSWDLESLKQLVCESVRETDDCNIHKDQSIVVAQQGIGQLVMYAFRSYYEAVVRNAKTGAVVYHLKCKDGASIQGLACTNQYYICAARYRYQKDQDVYFLEVFDAANGKLMRSVRGCLDDDIHELIVNQIGSHAMAVCSSEASKTSNLAVWNIETQDHRHIASHAQVATLCACTDLRACVTASKGENTVRIWNTQKLVNTPTPKPKLVEGIEGFIPMKSVNERQVIARSTRHGSMAVWDALTGKCLDKSIQIGSLQPSDVLIMNEKKAVVLTDKTAKGDDSSSVYSTILGFDLTTKQFTSQVKDCFIFQCPETDYVLLGEDELMGLSETRSHFVVWSLVTGQLVYRIKTDFRGKFKDTAAHSPPAHRKNRSQTARMLPWDRRLETQSARQKRRDAVIDEDKERLENLKKEKENCIDGFILSADQSIILASFYAHHICVFDVKKKAHIQTLENYDSMMLLFICALTPDGEYFVHTNYDDESKTSYLTLWNCRSGEIIRRIRNEKDVCTVAMNTSGSMIVFGKANQELRIWEPHNHHNPLRRIHGYAALNFGMDSVIRITENGTRAVVYTGDISLWDLDSETLLSVFTPDSKIQCFDVIMDGKVILFGLKDSAEVVTLKLRSQGLEAIEGEEVEEDDEEEEEGSEEGEG